MDWLMRLQARAASEVIIYHTGSYVVLRIFCEQVKDIQIWNGVDGVDIGCDGRNHVTTMPRVHSPTPSRS